uniref:p24 n=1 Tax=Pieris brassicae granulosis virus TaxID=10465 RepID=A0A7G9U8W8_GVPB|nr:p24 [Pieris brassicae granulovirus]
MSFDYNSGPIEVFIVSNEEKGIDGYAEVSAVVNLLSPFLRVNNTQIWNTTHPSYKVQNNGKNYLHAIAICKYLSSIPESDTDSYKNLRQLIRDLFVGDQKEIEDETRRELNEIKISIEELSKIKNTIDEIQILLTKDNNILSDFNGLLRILKSELLSELKPNETCNEKDNNKSIKENQQNMNIANNINVNNDDGDNKN